MQGFRKIVQVLFLAIFISLMVMGKAQFWMALIFISIALAALLGRYYCAWFCPINTLISPVDWLAKRLGTQKAEIPSSLKTQKPRYLVFTIFLFLLAYTIYSITQGHKFPLPLIIIPFGLLVTIFINPKAWHRYLCPWGTLFHFTGRFAYLGLRIDHSKCKSCKKCLKVCPGEAIQDNKNIIDTDTMNCLECFQCQKVCPSNAINFGTKPKQSETKPKKAFYDQGL